MQRNNQIKKLLTTERNERVKQISAFDREKIEYFIFLIQLEINSKISQIPLSLMDLLEDLMLEKIKLKEQSRNQMFNLFFSLSQAIREEYPREGREDKSIFHAVDVFKSTLQEMKELKKQLAERDEKIQIQKEQIHIFAEQYKKLEEENKIQKQYLDEMSKENISKPVLWKIIQKYKIKTYGYFSHAPTVLKALHLLYERSDKTYFSRFDIQACFKDPKNLFKHPPALRKNLSQREHLICDLADAFKDDSGSIPEIKLRLDRRK